MEMWENRINSIYFDALDSPATSSDIGVGF